MTLPDADNRHWIPGKAAKTAYQVEVPGDKSAGRYTLKVKMVKKGSGRTREVYMGVGESLLDEAHFMVIGPVRIR
jgi:hypothetical protein